MTEPRPDENASMFARELIERYNAGWNGHDLDAICALHAPEMVFENHTARERAEGPEVRAHIERIFENWPDLRFRTRRLYVHPSLAVCEWTATATHTRAISRDGYMVAPTGRRVEWEGVDVFALVGGLIARKDVYSDTLAVLQAIGVAVEPPVVAPERRWAAR